MSMGDRHGRRIGSTPRTYAKHLGGEEDWREQADRVEALGATRIAEHEVTE